MNIFTAIQQICFCILYIYMTKKSLPDIDLKLKTPNKFDFSLRIKFSNQSEGFIIFKSGGGVYYGKK